MSCFAGDDEIDAGGAVELGDDDAFGAVDDEFAAADHDGHVAEVDLLLAGGAVGQAEAQPDAERASVGEPELAALVRVVARFAEVVLDELQRQLLVVALDGEDFAQHPFQSRLRALVPGHIQLQEAVVRARLHFGQVRDVDGIAEATEVIVAGGGDDALSRDGHKMLLLPRRNEYTTHGVRCPSGNGPCVEWQGWLLDAETANGRGQTESSCAQDSRATDTTPGPAGSPGWGIPKRNGMV